MKSRILLTGLAAAVLTACGGGSGDGTTTTPAGGSGSAPVTTKISGTAAVGAALAGATVQAKCATGSGTATTAADGTFTINIDNATRPCVLAVTTPDGTTMHSVVEPGSGTSAVANITPLTELLTAALAGGSTTTFFTQFDKSAQGLVTTDGLTKANNAVSLVLTGVVDLTGIDPLKAPLVAANGSNAGNALDKLLDQLMARLATAKTTLADLSTAVGSNAGTTAIGTILQPASATCAGLRTGNYFMVMATANIVGTVKFNADTTSIVPVASFDAGAEFGPATPLTPVDGDACHFTGGTAPMVFDMMVAKSGMSMLVVPNPGVSAPPMLPPLLVPAQTLPVAELAGDWNGLGFERDDASAPYAPSRVKFTLDATGKMTAGADCTGTSTCSPWPAEELGTITANPVGGFDLTDSSGVARAVAFKGTDGQITAVIVHTNGILIATKAIARAMPVVGTKNSYWDLTAFADNTILMETASTTITAADPVTGVYSRLRNDGRPDTWTQNSPLPGLRYRAAANSVREGIAMTLNNTGVGVMISLSAPVPFFDISVNRPQ
ncbi:hypothetical protein [Cupriavidus campinensis]|uniref:hypothetical protein n=1 Tax=Cupriavidus campinensis TaxID=151783 RepID=UPI0011F0001A|nr:hypothetical protein [Cupriavidus campinensis]